MKYSLRSLMIVAIVAPAVIAGVIWLFVPVVQLFTPGSSANKAEFLRVIKRPWPYPGIHAATDRCFVLGALASDYKSVLAKADSCGPLDDHMKSKPLSLPLRGNGTQYVFWCGDNPKSGGKNSASWVYVIVDGKPPTIVHFQVVDWLLDPDP